MEKGSRLIVRSVYWLHIYPSRILSNTNLNIIIAVVIGIILVKIISMTTVPMAIIVLGSRCIPLSDWLCFGS